MTYVWRLLVLTILLMFSPHAAVSQTSNTTVQQQSPSVETNETFQQVDSLCNRRLSLLGGKNEELRDRLIRLKEAAGAPPKGGSSAPEKQIPQSGSGVAGPSGPVGLATILDSAQEQIDVSAGLYEAARQSAQRAVSETDPVAKQRYYENAIKKIRQAEDRTNRVVSAVDSLTPGSTPVQHGRLEFGDFRLLNEAKKMLDRGGTGGWEYALEQNSTEGGARPVEAGTPFFEQEQHLEYDEATETLKLKDGSTIDLAPLRQAVDESQQGSRGQSLLETVPLQSGGGKTVQPTSRLIETLSTPEVSAQMRRVGGVRLEVTLDALMLAGVRGLEGGSALERINEPVLISLRRFYESAREYRKNWSNLPSELRYPGGISRVHGFVFSRDGRDIVLVGAQAADPRDRIDIDNLILVLRSVWRDGSWPAVSLDPIPDRFEGPQYARILNVPKDSVLARIMLDADYAMKEIMLGHRRMDSVGFRPMVDRIAGVSDSKFLSRFWFKPMPLSPGSVSVSGSGRSVLFETGVELQTEAMVIRKGQISGTGSANAVAEDAARQFTDLFPILQRRSDIAPRGVFIRLQSLIDLASVATIWRVAGIDSSLLDGLAALPYLELTGSETVPSFYAAVNVPMRDGSGLRLVGGVEILTQASNQSIGGHKQQLMAAVEKAVDSFVDGGGLSRKLVLQITLPEQENVRSPEIMRAVIRGRRALAQNAYVEAVRNFREAHQLDPFDVEILLDLAVAESHAGNTASAYQAIERARKLSPGDAAVEMTDLDVRWRLQPEVFKNTADEADLVRLSKEYSIVAYQTLLAGNAEAAGEYADWAIQLWRDNGFGYMTVFWIEKNRDGRRARHALVQALRSYRRAYKRNEKGAAEALAFALSIGAMQRMPRAQVYFEPGGLETYGDYVNLRNEMSRAVEETQEAGALDNNLPLAPALEAQSRAIRAAVAASAGEGGDPGPIIELADDVVQRHPDFAYGWWVRSAIHMMLEDLQAALGDIDRAIELEPSAENYLARASIYASLGRCQRARDDLATARRTAAFTAPIAESRISDKCGN